MNQKALVEAHELYGVREGAPPIAPWPTAPCKLVFLDLDGVLNCLLSVCQLGTRYKFWPASIEALNELLAQSGARVVISSSWRKHWTLSDIAASLHRAGLLPGRVAGMTSVSNGRGIEIESWLKSVPYAVESFVILDDREDIAMPRQRLVLVDSTIGLGTKEVRQAIKVLAVRWHQTLSR